MHLELRILIVIAVLAFAGPLQAVTRYVAIDGNDAAGNTCTDSAAPCRTVGHAILVSAPAGDDIRIGAGAFTEPLTIDRSLRLHGAGEGVTILQAAAAAPGQPGDASQRVITISGMPEVEISDLTVRFGQDVNGGGILTGGTLTLTDVTVSSNAAFNEGGGMYNAGGSSPTLTNVTFSTNTASFGGGMFNINGSSPTLRGVTFFENEAGNQGGGLLNIFDSNPVLRSVTFSGNQAGVEGGGMYSFGSEYDPNDNIGVIFDANSAGDGGGLFLAGESIVILNDTRFESNSADNGGGIFLTDESIVGTDGAWFEGNSADNGGGIYLTDSSGVLSLNTHFVNNIAAANGGGIYVFESVANLFNVNFDANVVGGLGGGLYGEGDPPASVGCDPCHMLVDAIFNDNEADSGGGMHSLDGFDPWLINVAFSGNAASASGGGLSNIRATPLILNAVFKGNLAGNNGGGLYNSTGPLLPLAPPVVNVTFSGNAANNAGGGMFNDGAMSPAIRNTIFWHNQDSTGGSASGSINNSPVADPYIRDSLVQGCNPEGNWNTSCGTDGGNNPADANPLFIDTPDPDDAPAMAGNLRLQVGSPAIDAGDSSVNDSDTDLDGNVRIFGDAIDLGPYEWLADEIFSDRFEQ